LTVLVETGKGRFHTELGKLQREIRLRVRAGLITSESQLIEETRMAYEIAGKRTNTVVNAAELDAALVSNLGVQSETFAQTRMELAKHSGPTTVTDASIDEAFTEYTPPSTASRSGSPKPGSTTESTPPEKPAGGSKPPSEPSEPPPSSSAQRAPRGGPRAEGRLMSGMGRFTGFGLAVLNILSLPFQYWDFHEGMEKARHPQPLRDDEVIITRDPSSGQEIQVIRRVNYEPYNPGT
jgi:hypothetical protein